MEKPIYQEMNLFTDFQNKEVSRNVVGGTVLKAIPSLTGKKEARTSREKVSSTTSQSRKGKIEDFGEKIGGARKDVVQAYRALLLMASEDEIATLPITKSWPIPNYKNLLKRDVPAWRVDAVRALREVVPQKPRKYIDLCEWSKMVRTLREAAVQVLDGKFDEGDLFEYLQRNLPKFGYKPSENRSQILRNVEGKMILYAMNGHEESFSHLQFRAYQRGNEILDCIIENTGLSRVHVLGEGNSKEEAAREFLQKKQSGEISFGKQKNPMRHYAIYRHKEKNAPDWFFIGRTLGKQVVIVKERFQTVKAASEYLRSKPEEIEERFAAMRKMPFERVEENEERTGSRGRTVDVTPEEFLSSFGFRGVEFGNYVEDARRQEDLNHAYDALMDLSHAIGISSQALSLGGTLGLAFGSRGSGGAHAPMAHYEPDMVVINLTKRKGAGSLGHEWFHALDNHLAMTHHLSGTYVSNTFGKNFGEWDGSVKILRDENEKLVAALNQVMEIILKKTDLKKRSLKLDETRKEAYWSTRVEMMARVFEAYLKRKLAKDGIKNDYLVNIVSEEQWGGYQFQDLHPYPYPTKDELDLLEPSLDEMMASIHEVEQDGKKVLYSASAGGKAKERDIQPIPYDLLTPEELGIHAFGEQILGIDTAFFDGDEKLHGRFDSDKDIIYLNRSSELSLTWVIMHEAIHAIRHSDPALYEDILSFAGGRDGFTAEEIASYRRERKEYELSKERIIEEMIADAFADYRTGRRVVHDLSEKRPMIAARLFRALGHMVSHAKKLFFGSEKDTMKKKYPKARLSEEKFQSFSMHLESLRGELLSSHHLSSGEDMLLLAMSEMPGSSPVTSPYRYQANHQRSFDRSAIYKLSRMYPIKEAMNAVEKLSPLGKPGYVDMLIQGGKETSFSR